MIPFAGWASTAGKWGKKVLKYSDEVLAAAKHADEVGGLLGRSGKLTRRDDLLNAVQNSKLKNAISEIYRKGAIIGDGGLADAVRHELLTGELVGNKSHINKAAERIKNLENIIKKQNLSSEDLTIASKMLDELKEALGGK